MSYDRDYRGGSSYGGGGGYDAHRGGGGYDDRYGGSSSYGRGGGGYDDRRGGYDDRRGGYDDRRGRDDDRSRRMPPSNRTRLYVANIHGADVPALEKLFEKYGRIIDISVKEGFAFVEFESERDAVDAVRGRDGYDFNGQRIRVEHSKPRVPMGERGMDRMGGPPMRGGPNDPRGPPKCFNCGQEGHMARGCPNGDWSNRCYMCKEEGHRSNACPQRGGGVGLSSLQGGSGPRSGADSSAPAAASSSAAGGEESRDRRSRSRSPRRRSRSRSRDRDASSSAAPAQGGDAAPATGGDSAAAPAAAAPAAEAPAATE